MTETLSKLVKYRGDLLFDGAVDVSWLIEQRDKARAVGAAYIFHGPDYHGVSQEDVGVAHDHSLVDSATFLSQIVEGCAGAEERPFSLAIAGYGTGKSHFAATLSMLLSEPKGPVAEKILDQLGSAAPAVQEKVRAHLSLLPSPALVVTLNGMGNFDLATEFSRQILFYLRESGVDTRILDALRPRFRTAANLVKRLTPEEAEVLIKECGTSGIDEIVRGLLEYDETLYSVVHKNLSDLGFTVKAIGDETVTDVIRTICQEYVGEGRPYSKLVILFDEFGRYAEFATVRSQIAGSGVLQQLFEGVQSNNDKAMFVGFIQFDLNSYVQRMGEEYRNEILRVSTRYQTAKKSYLSINLETLIAHILEKQDRNALEGFFDRKEERDVSVAEMKRLNNWFPQSKTHRLWQEESAFHRIIRKGCWPLSPYACWLLYYLAAAGQHLQQRSALFLLGEAFEAHSQIPVSSFDWRLSATDLWSQALKEEFITAEERGNQGAVTLAYENVIAKVGQYLSKDEISVLQGVVLLSKLGAVTGGRPDSIDAIGAMTGLDLETIERTLILLEEERNVLSWDSRFNRFDITGDTVSRPQFLAMLQKKVREKYSPASYGALFVRLARALCGDFICDRDCDFSERHEITTSEWRYTAMVTTYNSLERSMEEAMDSWRDSVMIDQPRGSLIYCYVDPQRDLGELRFQAQQKLRSLANEAGYEVVPIVVAFFVDGEGILGRTLAEISVLDEELSEQERFQFGNLIENHREKSRELLLSTVQKLLLDREYVALSSKSNLNQSIKALCTDVFEEAYPKVIPFPFDGYGTSRGNAAETCHLFILELMPGNMSYDDVMRKPVRDKNRAIEVLKRSWGVFLKDGDISPFPENDVCRAVFEAWRGLLEKSGEPVPLASMIELACAPPFGGNIASSGLLLAVFFASKKDRLEIVLRGKGNIISPSEMREDMLFRGKHLDLSKLDDLLLMEISSEKISEWDSFLAEWEMSSGKSYAVQIQYMEKALALEGRISVPKSQVYRYESLKEKGKVACEKVDNIKKMVDDINKKLASVDGNDLHSLSFCGAKVKKIIEMVESDPLLATRQQLQKFHGDFERIRQIVVQVFEEWLPLQFPRGRTTKSASDFGLYMNQCGRSLKDLGLYDLAEKAEDYAFQALRKIDILAKAHNTLENIDSWLKSHEEMRSPRIVDLRNYRDVAKKYLTDVIDLSKEVDIPEISDKIKSLNDFISMAEKEEEKIKEQFMALYDVEFAIGDVDRL
ncbi:MAG: hypothetical protein EOM02_05150, partial [Synergistales bacterium]|nr:hypothetical protein [Synergistales bacterium]